MLKPDISAPGHRVKSAWNNGDNAYRTISGTSMACPHTAGGIALMISQNQGLNNNYDQIVETITNTANQDVTSGRQTCGGIRDSEFPNHVFGHGIIDAFGAMEYLNIN